jgi:hypothetical protein
LLGNFFVDTIPPYNLEFGFDRRAHSTSGPISGPADQKSILRLSTREQVLYKK